MYPFFFVLGEILLLFFLSRLLTRTISRLIHSLTGSMKSIVYGIAMLFLPGTLIHELAHYLMAKILFVHAGEISLLPKIEGDMIKMGSVQIEQTDPVRKLLIGIAPLIVGSTLLGLLYYFSASYIQSYYSWQILIPLIATFEIANTMFSSRKDMEGTLILFIILALIGLVCLIFQISLPSWLVVSIQQVIKLPFFQTLSMYLAIPLAIDLLLIGIIKVLFRY